MSKIIHAFLASLMFINAVGNAAHSDRDAKNNESFQVFATPDLCNIIIINLSLIDKISLSMVSTSIRQAIVPLIRRDHSNDFHKDIDEDMLSFFTRLAELKGKNYCYNKPITALLSGIFAKPKVLGKLLKETTSISTKNLTIKSYTTRLIQEDEDLGIILILSSQPELETLSMVNFPHKGHEQALFAQIKECRKLTSCQINGENIKVSQLNCLSSHIPLEKLSITLHEWDANIKLPETLSVITIQGKVIPKQLFSCLSTLPKLTSVSISESSLDQSEIIDVSEDIISLFKKGLTELFIGGRYRVNGNVIQAFAQNNTEQARLRLVKNSLGAWHFNLGCGPKAPQNNIKFSLSLPEDDIDSTVKALTSKITDNRAMNLDIYWTELRLTEYEGDLGVEGLTVKAHTWGDELTKVLNHLPEKINIPLFTLDVSRDFIPEPLVIDHALLWPIFKRKWQRIEIKGHSSYTGNLFAPLKINTPAVNIDLTIHRNSTQTFSIEKAQNNQGKFSYSSFRSDDEARPIPRELVLAAALLPNMNGITIDGFHNLSVEDLAQIETFGFIKETSNYQTFPSTSPNLPHYSWRRKG